MCLPCHYCSGGPYSGVINCDSKLFLGPDGLGRFFPVVVKSIHCKDMPVTHVVAGQEATFALRLETGEKVGLISHRERGKMACVLAAGVSWCLLVAGCCAIQSVAYCVTCELKRGHVVRNSLLFLRLTKTGSERAWR